MSERESHCSECERHKQELTSFRQEVSDAVEEYTDRNIHAPITYLGRFIIAKPDPLVEVCDELGLGRSVSAADELTAAIEKRGGKIVWEDK